MKSNIFRIHIISKNQTNARYKTSETIPNLLKKFFPYILFPLKNFYTFDADYFKVLLFIN